MKSPSRPLPPAFRCRANVRRELPGCARNEHMSVVTLLGTRCRRHRASWGTMHLPGRALVLFPVAQDQPWLIHHPGAGLRSSRLP